MGTKIVKPNFFIIGAAKSGTTALSEYLREHPNVFFCTPKEPGYFANDFKDRSIVKESHYLKLFEGSDPSKHFAIGEGSVIYLMSNIALQNILRFEPKAKIIVMIRNPVDVVLSLHSQRLKGGIETIPNFCEAWDAEIQRRQGRNIPLTCAEPKELYYSDWGRLGSRLQYVRQLVPSEQLLEIVFDDFRENTPKVYRQVLHFLGLPDDNRTYFPRVNARAYPYSSKLVVSLRVAMRLWEPLRKKLGYKGTGLATKIIEWNSKPEPQRSYAQERQFLTEFFMDEICLLESLLQRDLSHWKKTKL